MSDVPCSFFTLRVVPHPYTGAGVPVGVVLQSRPAEYLGLRAITDADRLGRIAPDVDIELLTRYLRSYESIAAGEEDGGEIALLSRPERFHWLAAPRSDVLQPSPVEHRMADDPAVLLETLFAARVGSGLP
jgi:hypothetical protein